VFVSSSTDWDSLHYAQSLLTIHQQQSVVMRGLFLFVFAFVLLSACGGGGSGSQPTPQPPPPAPAAPAVNIEVGLKQLIFSWDAVSGATTYRLLENADGHSGFSQVGEDIPAGTLSVSLPIAVHFQDFTNALYMVEACNVSGCNGSTALHAMNGMLDAIGYFKASNTGEADFLGMSIALSADGSTLALGASGEDSNATGIDGDQSDNSASSSGAVYVFRFDGADWSQQAYIKASNTEEGDDFGHAVSLSADGNTLAVGARYEDSGATGINGDQSDNSVDFSGAVYLFRFDGANWSQQAYVKASNTGWNDGFGGNVSLSADGNTLVVAAALEDSSATGVDGDQSDNSVDVSGAVYLFRFDGANWSQQVYIKASNTEEGDWFGSAVALSADGSTLAVGAGNEDSNATGINGDQYDDSARSAGGSAGAVYLFRFDGVDWSQQAYIKASNTEIGDKFGSANAVALSADGNTLAVGARYEDSGATGINGDQSDNSVDFSGAVYLFRFDGADWSQQAYVKASNTDFADGFGWAVSLSTDGNTLAVGAILEGSGATGINGDQSDNSAPESGAVYVY
jgi:hypothetical protein